METSAANISNDLIPLDSPPGEVQGAMAQALDENAEADSALLKQDAAALSLPESRNKTRFLLDRGFWGAMGTRAEAAWPMALTAIAEATGASLETVRLFLDTSRRGRYFASNILMARRNALNGGKPLSLAEAIHEVIEDWMTMTIDEETEDFYGIPAGLPYLTGWVFHCEVDQETRAH